MIEYKYNIMKNVEIINEIIKIETNAQELIKNAKREQTELPVKISGTLDSYKIYQNEKALEKIKNARIAEEKSTKEKIERINKEHEQKLGKLKKIVDENINSWVEKIYSFIITPTEI